MMCRYTWEERSSGPEAAVLDGRLRPDGADADGRDRDDLPRARREDRPLGRLPQPHRPRQPARAVERRDRVPRQGAQGGAGAFPRVPDPHDHGAPRAQPGSRRPALQAPRSLTRSYARRRNESASVTATMTHAPAIAPASAPPERSACHATTATATMKAASRTKRVVRPRRRGAG